jgi:hypothetical protein
VEVKAVGRFLNDPAGLFQHESVAEDGFCLFDLLYRFAYRQLGCKDKVESFCRKIGLAAVKSLERTRRELGDGAVEQSALDGLKKLSKARKPVQQLTEKKLWEELEAQHILLGFKEMFKDAKINLYRAPDNGGNVRITETYGAEEGTVELHILHWNTLRHFDGLILR